MTSYSEISDGEAGRLDPDRPVALHSLVYLREGDEVTVGRRDTDSYGVVGPDAAELIRRLEAGTTPRAAAKWFESEYGEAVDVLDVVAALDELGLVRKDDEPPATAGPVRWTRLGAAAFSAPAWLAYIALLVTAAVTSLRRPDLMPSYRHMFFTDYYAVVSVVMFLAAIPQLLLHEAFHALAGRRLGLRSSLSIGRRLHFVVLETSMDGLVAVPRRKRYLPILAGMLADLLVVAALTILADLNRMPGGSFSLTGRVCLAVSLAVWLRILWQFSFYLRTDLYVLIATVTGCVDLHTTAKRLLRNRINRLLGRRDRLVDESQWHPADRRVARWYSWLIGAGYTISTATFVFVVAPITLTFATGVIGRFTGAGQVPLQRMLDSAVVLAFTTLQLAILGWLVLRDRRRVQRQFRHALV